ncbi:hypothetical protein AVEN_42493-1 [Araneus ventricosus]|uniref:Tesmin/TSO1-like CXC domain-containing protein n=1 Tax=Araneus ventricosus TaxID=182803 RepID=A0A4Y2K8R4_ARAVE|nr:hypothetical protein AVEN_42493-1 [Araneus ventricosus]
MDFSQSPPRNQFPSPQRTSSSSLSLYDIMKCAKGCNLTCTCRKSGIKFSTICYHCKGQGCTNSPEDDNIITNSTNQEAEIDNRMEEIISEVDLEEECQTMKVEKSDSKQTAINGYDSPSTSKQLKLI